MLDEITDAFRDDSFGTDCSFAVEPYGYLRGVDGETAPRRVFESETLSIRNTEPPRVAPYRRTALPLPMLFGAPAEPAYGVTQLDYMRRLSAGIARVPLGGNPVAAVGVLGADVYDKSLIIQALREQLPGTTFFTTDLDARLLAPNANRWMRNLIVGSAHGLARGPCGRAEFRDSYQTAFFHAVSLALASQAASAPRPAPSPRLFEIGRVHAVDITRPYDDERIDCYGSDELESGPSHLASIFALIAPMLGLALFAILRWWYLGTTSSRIRRRYNGFLAIGASATAVLLAAATMYYRTREPWPLLEGVSSVPMIAYGYTTIAYAIAIVVLARGRTSAAWHGAASLVPDDNLEIILDRFLRRMRRRRAAAVCRRIRRAGHFAPRAVFLGASGYCRRFLNDTLVSTWMRDLSSDDENAGRTIRKVLFEFRKRSCIAARSMRIASRVFLVGAMSWAFIRSASNDQPLISYWDEHIQTLVWLVVLAVYVAVFYCVDTVNMWKAVVRALGHYDVSGWKARDDEGLRNGLAIRVRRSMEALVRCTDFVEPVVVMPLVLMTMLVLSWSTLFEGWNWTGELIAFHVVFVGYIFTSVFLFQRQASRTRDSLLDRLDGERFRRAARERVEIEMEMKRIRNNRKGAFVPWVQHPVLQSLAVPVGGVTIIALLEAWLLP